MKGDVMSLIGSEYDLDEKNAELLKSWVTAGKWSREQATLLFLDIDPDRTHGDCFSTFSGQGSIQYEFDYVVGGDLCGFRVPQGVDDDGEEVYLTSEQETLLHKTRRMCKNIERKINLHESAEPRDWIDLALTKKTITIPWLDWAIENNLYTRKEAPASKPTPDTDHGETNVEQDADSTKTPQGRPPKRDW